MHALYFAADISRQAVSQQHTRDQLFQEQVLQLIMEADELRKEHPGCGVEKMYNTLNPDFLGRDRFLDIFMDLGYRLKRPRNYQRTTFPSKVYYPNLIKGMVIDAPSVVWQSDITYIRVGDRFFYVVFIIDVYTKIIVGYAVSMNMRADANVKALEMALAKYEPPVIHHSDRGTQYTYKPYLELLKQHNCQISMALSAQDNAYAERINLTIKDEYLKYWIINTFEKLVRCTRRAVNHYNQKRPHDHLGRVVPREFLLAWQNMPADLRPKITIFDNQTLL